MELIRNCVIVLYLAGKSQPAIVHELRHLRVNKMFVYRTIKRYKDTGSIAKRHGGGHKKTATSQKMVRRVEAEIQLNPRQSASKLAKSLEVSNSSIRRILKNELRLKPCKIQKVDKQLAFGEHFLSTEQKPGKKQKEQDEEQKEAAEKQEEKRDQAPILSEESPDISSNPSTSGISLSIIDELKEKVKKAQKGKKKKLKV